MSSSGVSTNSNLRLRRIPSEAASRWKAGAAWAARRNGTSTGTYVTIGKFAHIQARLVLGTTSAVTGNVQISAASLPAAVDTSYLPSGAVTVRVGSGASAGALYWCGVISNVAGALILKTVNTSGNQNVTATTPITFASTDSIDVTISYKVA